jgi:hypothetical protein
MCKCVVLDVGCIHVLKVPTRRSLCYHFRRVCSFCLDSSIYIQAGFWWPYCTSKRNIWSWYSTVLAYSYIRLRQLHFSCICSMDMDYYSRGFQEEQTFQGSLNREQKGNRYTNFGPILYALACSFRSLIFDSRWKRVRVSAVFYKSLLETIFSNLLLLLLLTPKQFQCVTIGFQQTKILRLLLRRRRQ